MKHTNTKHIIILLLSVLDLLKASLKNRHILRKEMIKFLFKNNVSTAE